MLSPEVIVAVIVVLVIQPVEGSLFPIVQCAVDVVVLHADARMVFVRIVAVGHEQHIADKGVKPVTNPDAVIVRLSGKVGFHFALGVELGTHAVNLPRVCRLYEGLLHIVCMRAEDLSEEVLMDIGLQEEVFAECQPVAFYLLARHGQGGDELSQQPVYGGSSIESQIRALKRGVHIIVATPGRLLDLMERKTVSLSTIQNVVMDEADEMLNMGFTDSINAILADVPQERNTLLFSATMSPEIARISKKYLHNAKEITIGRRNEGTSNVKHVVFTVHAKDKYAALKRIVDYYPQIYGIIFCRTRKETQEIADKLMQEGYNADSLHGELSQAQRDTVMQKFRIRNLQLLVATDVAARGLDVDDLTHVINYGLPDDTESYTHRSGRTGRAGKTGTSIAIINLREKGKMREIERIIGKKFIAGEMPTGKQICEKQLLKVIDDLEKVKVNEEEIADFMTDIYRKLDWLSKEDLIKRMVSHEFNRFLDYYRGRDEIETATGSERGARSGERGDRNDRRSSRKAEPGFTRLFINLGKMDNFFPNELISLLNNNTRGRVELGRIDLMQKFSFFEVEEKEATNVVKALNRASWNGRKVSVEVAGDEGKEAPRGKRPGTAGSHGKKEFDSKKRSYKEDGKRNDATGKRSEKAESPANDKKKGKPSREERGYTKARGKKDDWKQFFQGNNDFKDAEPDFSEEGWARRTPKKK